jgi:hypothetical protein
MPVGLKTSNLVNCPSSMSSYLVGWGDISWQSIKQAVVVISSIEYIYVYISIRKEAIWLES